MVLSRFASCFSVHAFNKLETVGLSDFSSQNSSLTYTFTGWTGQLALSLDRNSGPCNHKLLSLGAVALISLDTMSAGFSDVGQYLHRSGGAFRLISFTRFSTNCLYSLSLFLIHDSGITESVQLTTSSTFTTFSKA